MHMNAYTTYLFVNRFTYTAEYDELTALRCLGEFLILKTRAGNKARTNTVCDIPFVLIIIIANRYTFTAASLRSALFLPPLFYSVLLHHDVYIA